MKNIRDMTILELCEIYNNLYMGLWDVRLGNPPGAERDSAGRLSLNDTLPYILEIQKVANHKELCRYRHVVVLGESEDEFETWWRTYRMQGSVERTKRLIKLLIVASASIAGAAIVKMIAAAAL